MKSQIFTIIQILVAASLIGVILLQAKGTGLGSALGNQQLYRSKRGAEKVLFVATIILASLFLILSLVNVLIW